MNSKQKKIIMLCMSIGIIIFGLVQIINQSRTLTQQDYSEIPFQKGMSFTTWTNNSFNTPATFQEFQHMKDIGIEWIAINHWWWQDYLNSTAIHMGAWSDTYDNLTACFIYARSIGLHILYKPMLNLEKTYEWRSYIEFTPEWMGNYTAWMIENARAAEAGDVEILSIGCEMGNMQTHSNEVREMISQIRAEYSGLLTYSANHDSFALIDWYDAIDIIGISMYTMMSLEWDPSVNTLTNVWNGLYSELETLSLKWNRPIIFSETGIQAIDGSNMIPNDNQLSDVKDVEEMRNYYLSLFNSKIWSSPWFKGAYWWIWDYADENDPTVKSFNPVLIQDTIANEYSKDYNIEANQNYQVPLGKNITLLVVGIVMVIGVLIKAKNNFTENLETFDNMESLNNNDDNPPKKQLHFIGLITGSILAMITTIFVIRSYSVIQKSFSYSVILHISPVQTILTYCGIVIGAFLLGGFLSRYVPRYTILLLFFLITTYPFGFLSVKLETIFIQTFFDILVLALLIGIVINAIQKVKLVKDFDTSSIKIILGESLLVLTAYIGLSMIFESSVQIFLAIPIGIALLLSDRIRTTRSINIPQTLEPKTKSVNPKNGLIFLFTSFLAGILIPFGNSTLNLINMNFISVGWHYIPALLSACCILVLYFVLKSAMKFDESKVERILKRVFTTTGLLYTGMGLVIVGIPVIFVRQLNFIWWILSGLYLLQYLGTFIRTLILRFQQPKFWRNFMWLILVVFFFAAGFILNGIKGLFIYQLTFLVFKDGAFVIRDPLIDPVPPFNVPVMINGIILGVSFIVSSVTLIIEKVFKKFLKKRSILCSQSTNLDSF